MPSAGGRPPGAGARGPMRSSRITSRPSAPCCAGDLRSVRRANSRWTASAAGGSADLLWDSPVCAIASFTAAGRYVESDLEETEFPANGIPQRRVLNPRQMTAAVGSPGQLSEGKIQIRRRNTGRTVAFPVVEHESSRGHESADLDHSQRQTHLERRFSRAAFGVRRSTSCIARSASATCSPTPMPA